MRRSPGDGDQRPSDWLGGFGESGADEPPLPRESDAEGLGLDASLPDAVPDSFDEPSFEDFFEGALREEESEVAALRESVL
ncbi:MAG: hypothetical protein M3R49_01685 [Chloroflexota bacterium]|nr:hypothetical protein [Chloroflexota bacterium]